MKRLFFFLLILWLPFTNLFGQTLKKREEEKGYTVRGNVTWKYNEYIGTKADVGAKVILLRRFEEKVPLEPFKIEETDKAKGIHVTQVNMLGQYELTNIPPGVYDLLIVSKATNRNVLVKLNPLEDTWERMERSTDLYEKKELISFTEFKEYILIPHFLEKDYEKATLSLLGGKKYYVKGKVELASGDVKEINYDFGKTSFTMPDY